MILAAILLMQAAPPPALKVDWLARPGPREFAACAPDLRLEEPTLVTLQCRATLKNRVEACKVRTSANDPRVAAAAQCAVRKMRVRVTDPTGQAVVGVDVATSLELGVAQKAP